MEQTIESLENIILELDENIKQVYIFNDSGDGWNVAIKSEKPITSKIKKLIIDAMELLEVKE